jgi:hypothetical protein
VIHALLANAALRQITVFWLDICCSIQSVNMAWILANIPSNPAQHDMMRMETCLPKAKPNATMAVLPKISKDRIVSKISVLTGFCSRLSQTQADSPHDSPHAGWHQQSLRHCHHQALVDLKSLKALTTQAQVLALLALPQVLALPWEAASALQHEVQVPQPWQMPASMVWPAKVQALQQQVLRLPLPWILS